VSSSKTDAATLAELLGSDGPVLGRTFGRNRRDRRAAMAISRRRPVDRVVAVHEAGHAVARVLFAEPLGWSPDEVILHVDIHPAPVAIGAVSSDGAWELQSQAVTYEKLFSRPMQEFFRAKFNQEEVTLTVEILEPLVAEMRATGIDVDGWYLAKSVGSIFGPMAEAKLLGRPFDVDWEADSAQSDYTDLVRYGVICGLTTEQIESSIIDCIRLAEQLMARPEVWSAILALAARLRYGRTEGRVAGRIIRRALAVGGQRP
jgi:hypothetical protein